MTPRSVVIEFYVALERATGEGSVDKARKAARSLGLKFTNAESAKWLAPFTAAAGKRRENGAQNGVNNKHETAGTTAGDLGLARDKGIPSLFLIDSSLRSSSGAASQPPVKKPRQTKLPYDRPLLDRRDAILKAAWALIQPVISRATTFTVWRKRNNEIAVDLAKAGVTPRAVVAAWQQATDRIGEPVRELSIVQKEIERAYAERAAAGRVAQG